MDLPVTNDLAERAARRRGARAAALAQPAVPVVELRDLSMVYPGGHVGLDRVSLKVEPRRVRLPRRPDRLRQVHGHPRADEGARGQRG